MSAPRHVGRIVPTPSIAATSALLVIALSHPARAQSRDAEALFRDGERQFAAGELTAACASFEASNRIEPRAGTYIRLGYCREHNGQLASAWSAYDDALRRVKDVRKQRIAQTELDRLAPRLSQLTIALPRGHQLAGLIILRNGVVVDAGSLNRSLPVDGGSYVIEAQAPGHQPWATAVEVAIERARITVEVPRLAVLGPEARDTASAHHAAPLQPPPPSERGGRPLGTRRIIAIGLAVGGVAATAGGIGFGLSSRSLARDAHALCPELTCPGQAAAANQLMDRSRRHVRSANLAYGTAGALAVAAAVLWFTGADHADRDRGVSVMPTLAPDQAGAVVTGSF